MRKLILFTLLAISFSVSAQAPEGINYQAVIRNGGGTLITNTTVAIRVQIRQNSATGTIVYQERHSALTSAYGLVNLVIGAGTVQSGSFATINWSTGSYFVNLAVDFSNGITYQDFGSQKLMSVPYALYAKNSGNQLNQWRYGNIVPASTLGNFGDFYLDVITGNVYYKESSTSWILTGNIKGPVGPTGATGATGAAGPQGATGASGTNGQNTLVKTSPESAGVNCNTGGVKIEYGLDANNNGVLDATEINAALTKYVCNGAQGPTGLQGAPGAQGQQGLQGTAGATGATGLTGATGASGKNSLIKTTTETAGVNCTTGGVKIEYGLDANSNGVLDATEINATLTKYVCNGAVGATGATGSTGPTGAQGQTGLTGAQGIQGPAGPTGAAGAQGVQGTTGATGATGPAGTNGTNGTNGQNTLVKTTTETPGVNCTTGGIKLEYGLDANSNGVLDVAEVNATLTKYVCNGAVGATGPSGASGPAGAQGLTGATGAQGAQGIQGATGATGPAGSNGTNGTNGTNGQNTLVKTTTETAGANCTTGGVKLEYGLDANSNGVLDMAEVNATLTKYVCNGAVGATGAQGPTGLTGANGAQGATGQQGPIGLTGTTGATGPAGTNGTNGTNGINGQNTVVKTTTEAAGANCTTGGIKLEYGLDANSNGVLDANEINATLTKYVCNGTVGVAGATGPQGPAGPTGATGPTGAAGPQGTVGPTGAVGPQGNAGTNGTNGVGITSTVDNGNGTFTLNYSDGTSFTTADMTGPQGIQGLQGSQGLTGATGSQGPAGTNGVGITSTVDNGNGTFTLSYSDGSSFTTANLTGPQGPVGSTGATGSTGAQGIAGTNGLNALIKTTAEPAGANCANGGTKIETGLDADGNGTLDAGEVNAGQTRYVCDGSTGGSSLPNGTNQGEMLYWNGTSWVNVPPGQTGQYLTFCYNAPQWGPCFAQITTTPISNITGFNAISGGQITNDGGTAITARGVCWDVSPTPDLSDNFTTDGTGIGSFTSNLINLIPNTTYNVRAYATNSAGTIYGNQIIFTSGATLPTVNTGTSSNVSYNSATVSGEVTADGGAAVTQRGICYSTSQNPTISNSFVVSGSGIGSFSSNISGLTGNTTYYARVYATNNSGTAYGSQISFTTFSAPAAQSCSGWNGPNATSSLMNAQGWITATVGQSIDISMVTTHPFITCCQGPSQNCGASSIFNPSNSNLLSYSCGGQTISESISIPTSGIYQLTVVCGNIGYRTCNLSIEIIP